MKKAFGLIAVLAIVGFSSCKKDNDLNTTPTNPGGYASLADFFSRNGVPTQIHIVDAAAGGSFTSPQGTMVTIPSDAFVTMTNQPVSGNVIIEFRDIYKKSDMFLSDKPTMMSTGEPLKSGGEFYIKASTNNQLLKLAPGKQIEVHQPAVTGPFDPGMTAFTQQQNPGWLVAPNNAVNSDSLALFNYVFSLSGLDSGEVWCNSDNAAFFAAYTQTTLTLHPNYDLNVYPTAVYLVFQTVNSAIHVYENTGNFPYHYAPVGLQCSAVAVAVKDGKLYYSITPFTISANMTVNFDVVPVTEAELKNQLNSLN